MLQHYIFNELHIGLPKDKRVPVLLFQNFHLTTTTSIRQLSMCSISSLENYTTTILQINGLQVKPDVLSRLAFSHSEGYKLTGQNPIFSLFLLEMRTLGKFGSLKRLYTEHLIFQSNIDGKLFNHQYTQEHYEFDEHGEILAL